MVPSFQAKCWQTGWLRLGLAGATVLLIALRKYGRLVHPQFYGEDGALFFVQAEAHPWGGIYRPYAGYLHLVPRAIALIGSRLPVLWMPGWYAWCSLFLAGIVAWTVLSPRVRLPCGWAAALAIGAVPNSGEVYLNICTLQFILAIALMALLVTDAPLLPAQQCGDIVWLIVTGLTGPFIVMFSPLFVWRACRQPSRWNFRLLALALGCTGVQLFFLLQLKPLPPLYLWTPLHEIAGVCRRWLLLGLPANSLRHEQALATLGIALTLVGGLMCWIYRRVVPEAWMLLAGSLAIIFFSLYKSYHNTWDLADAGNGDRYFFAERIFILWLCAILAWLGPRILRPVALLLAMALLIVNGPHFIHPPDKELNWQLFARRIQQGLPTKAPILPVGWYLDYPGRPAPGRALP